MRVGKGCSRIIFRADPRPGVIETFDRVLIAGFLAGTVLDRERDIDINSETARLLRMTLRSRA